MGKISDAKTWLLLTAGWGLAISIGLLAVASQLGEPPFAAYAGLALLFYLAVLVGAPRLVRSRHRRRLSMIAALVNTGICSFGMIGGFAIFGPSLIVLLALSFWPERESATRPGAAIA